MNSSFPANHIHVNGEIRKNLVDIMSYVRFDASNKKKNHDKSKRLPSILKKKNVFRMSG